MRAELRQERPPLCPGPLHPVLGPPPPAASPQALSREFTRNPAILRPLCRPPAPRLPLLAPAGTTPRARAAQSHQPGFIHRDSGTLQDPHEAQRPSAPAPSLGALGCPPLFSPDKGCQSGDAPASSLQQLQRLAGREGGIARSSCFAPYWPLSLSCWYSLCSRTACSNKGRFIPSTHVSTRAFTTQLPSETHTHQGPGRVSNTPFRGVLFLLDFSSVLSLDRESDRAEVRRTVYGCWQFVYLGLRTVGPAKHYRHGTEGGSLKSPLLLGEGPEGCGLCSPLLSS